MPYSDSEKQKQYQKNWYLTHKYRHKHKMRRWHKENPEKAKEFSKKHYKEMKELYPWKLHYKAVQQRCQNPNHRAYYVYGGRGIKLSMTVEDFKYLWNRDKAWLLLKPSIDRKNPDGNYEISNCRFIELRENQKNQRIKRDSKGRFESIMDGY